MLLPEGVLCLMSKSETSVGVLLGSISDLEVVQKAFKMFDDFGVSYEVAVISAHRTPELLEEYIKSAPDRGIQVIIAAAGLSAALPGVVASGTILPVIGLPIDAGTLGGLDALLSISQMPPGVPVATVGIGSAKNAVLLALRILAVSDTVIRSKLEKYSQSMAKDTVDKGKTLKENGLPVWSP